MTDPATDQAIGAAISASSVDGRSFTASAESDLGLRVGDYLVVDDGDGDRLLGMIERVEHLGRQDVAHGALRRAAGGRGRPGPPAAFRDRPAVRAGAPDIADLLAGRPAAMELGRLILDPAVGVGLQAKRLNRHTFWCGQSGSGKTYALGVALEQILLHTRLPIVIFDPNSDFVRLDQVRPDAPEAAQASLAERDIRILRPGDGPDSLRVRYRDLSSRAKAVVLQLDPVVDRHEYNVMMRLAPMLGGRPGETAELLAGLGPEGQQLLARLENLEIFSWRTWTYDRRPATDVIAERPAATVLDLGGFDRVEEQLSVALAVLDDLWSRREERRPVLLVIDEAHNLCAPDMDTLLGRAVRDRLIQIAAEGRKFGLWLLVSTQRPSKVHPGIVSQCDNLTLMRMNSPGDLAELREIFGFVPAPMLDQAARFAQGEALVAGGFVAAPSIVQVGARITREGGIDVPVPMP